MGIRQGEKGRGQENTETKEKKEEGENRRRRVNVETNEEKKTAEGTLDKMEEWMHTSSINVQMVEGSMLKAQGW